MKPEDATTAGMPPVDRPVGRLVDQRASACGLTECAGKAECGKCKMWRDLARGMPVSGDERYLRRLLALRVGMPHIYYDDGEASGQEHGISIDFMREPVADIDAKLRALNVARLECWRPRDPGCWCARCDMEHNVMRTRMSVCDKCGDKRCPRADDHRNECREPPNPQLTGRRSGGAIS